MISSDSCDDPEFKGKKLNNVAKTKAHKGNKVRIYLLYENINLIGNCLMNPLVNQS